jgi:hypothetical protein
MQKVILFPFDITEDNRKRYCETMQKAKAEKATLILFTSLPEAAKEKDKDAVYFHLLELNGHYQTAYNNWTSTADISIQRMIHREDMLQNLSKVVQLTTPDSIIINNASPILNQERISEVLV